MRVKVTKNYTLNSETMTTMPQRTEKANERKTFADTRMREREVERERETEKRRK